ncbi:CHAT domain-containing protein [Tenacibaculum xiamenense]|uniref:CHAT domain-containing protein n=1 Tax=Tenacibaculum xiamenense TaxID=1261553 RepID=UPI003895EB0A
MCFFNKFIYHLFLSLSLTLCSLKTYSQYSYKELLELDKKISITETYADSILSAFEKKDALFAKNAHGFSYFFYRERQNFDLGIKYGLVEKSVLENVGLKNSDYSNILYNIGKYNFLKKEYNIALDFYKKSINSDASKFKSAQSYCQVGYIYFLQGDYHKSLNYYLKGLPLIEKHGTIKSLLAHSINFALVCNKLNSKKSIARGLYYLNNIDSIIKTNSNTSFNKSHLYNLQNGFGNLYTSNHFLNSKKANFHYNKGLNLAKKLNDHYLTSIIYSNLGELYLKMDNDSSLYYFSKSLSFNLDGESIANETHKNISLFYLKKNVLEKSLNHIEKSLNLCFLTKRNSDIRILTSRELLNTKDKRVAVSSLALKSTILFKLYLKTNNLSFLKKLIKNTSLLNDFITLLINYNTTEIDTKYLWREEVYDSFNLSTLSAYLLNDKELMFRFMEVSKTFLLLQEISKKRQLLNLPFQLTKRDNDLRRTILSYEERLDNSENFDLRDSIFSLKTIYQNFKDSIQKIYPEYTSPDQKIEPITLETLKKSLDKNDVIISFSMSNMEIGETKSNLIGLAITKNKTIPLKAPDSEKTIESLSTYRKLLSTPLKTKEELNEFKLTASFLYNQLFPTSEIKNLIQQKNVLIVPDVTLENTPLEALISEKDSFRYLIQDCNISYAYSLTFSELNKDLIRKTSNDISFYSPIKFGNTTISSLPFTEKESNNIEGIISGDFLEFNNASKRNFINYSPNSKIIHLATHANASGNPQIQFYDSILPLHELYTYKNNADLVVLSACETNLGEIKKGEGVLSLARGFFHSGANSVVSSLWKINDASTSEIMTNFYKNLKDNQPKTLALNNAKRSYLKNHSLSEKSPYYWASFILIGDTNPVFEDYYFELFLLSMAILVILLVVFKFYNKKWVTNF